MQKKVLILILLIGLSAQQCTIGCQKCSTDDKCLLCDIINNYYLTSNTCAVSSQTNCRVLALSGDCVSCNSGYYVDSTTKRCLQVDTLKVVTNCLYYDSSQACVTCNSGRFLNAGACTASTVTVANCNIYSAEAKCAQCQTGYIFLHNLDECSKIPDNLNCLLYTHVNCTQCSAGYVYNRNAIGNTLFSANQGYDLLTKVIYGSTIWGKLAACQAKVSLNCDQQNLFNECISCQAGYFFRNKQCVANPAEPIFGCAVYSNANTCTSCVEFMYPFSATSCVNNTVIANCIAFDSTASGNQCKECSKDYYLSTNTCILRVNSLNIVDCLTRTLNADTCASCVSGYSLTDDKLLCLQNVANCKTYAASTVNTLYLVCSTCVDGWYLNVVGNTVLCVRGSVSNCKVYDQGSVADWTNKCTVCNNEYYVSNGLCVAHQKINNCDTYSQSTANRCDYCKVGLHPFHLTTVCVAVTAISNCNTYSPDSLTCLQCASGYYPVGNTCVAIPSSFTNCEQFDGQKCTRCASGFNVDTKHYLGTCYKVTFDYLFDDAKAYCYEYATLATNQISTFNQYSSSTPAAGNNFYPIHCKACAKDTIPYLPNYNEAVCVKEADIVFYSRLSGSRNDNCLRFGLSYGNRELVCMQCKATYVLTNYHFKGYLSTAYNSVWNTQGVQCSLQTGSLLPDTGAAVSNTAMLIMDDLMGFVNIIVPASTSTGYITNSAAPLQGCTRAVRINFTQLPTTLANGIFNGHYICTSTTKLATSLMTQTNNKYYLTVNSDQSVNGAYGTLYTDTQRAPGTNGYGHVTPLNDGNTPPAIATTPDPFNIDSTTETIRFDFNHGYTTTELGPFPSVFNYKGILLEAEVRDVSTELTATAGYIESFTNCELIYRQTANAAGQVSSNAWLMDPTTNTVVANNLFYKHIVHSTTTVLAFCMRCAFGYSLGWKTPTAVANNYPFPHCSANTDSACTVASVYGGLPPFLNHLLSCHQCTTGNFPQISIETNAGTGGTITATVNSRFLGWDVFGAYATATSLVNTGRQIAAGCFAVPTTDQVVTAAAGTAAAISTFTTCGAFGFINPIRHSSETRDITTVGGIVNVQAGIANRICLACKANNWPVYAIADNTSTNFLDATVGVPGFAVVKCIASLNCDTSITTQFNGCAKCKTSNENDQSPLYYGFIDALLADCAQTNTQNCFLLRNFNGALVATSVTTKYICGVCKAGYFMNADSICEAIKIPNMDTAASFFSTPVISGLVFDPRKTVGAIRADNAPASATGLFRLSYFIKVHFLLSQVANPYGVRACKTGWVQGPTNYNVQGLCVYSTYVSKQTFGPGNFFIANCERYAQGDNELRNKRYIYPATNADTPLAGTYVYQCDFCKSGYVLAFDYLSCVAQGNTPNCLRFQTGSIVNCQNCLPGYLNVANKCVLASTIANCKTLFQTVDYVDGTVAGYAELRCSVCNDGYYRTNSDKECALGKVFNCGLYGTAGTGEDCTSCKAGFGLLTTNSVKYCYPIPSDSNCAEWQNTAHSSGLNYHTFSCSKCASTSSSVFGIRSWDYLPTLTAPWKCLDFTLIPDCVAYNQNKTVVKENDFKCYQCKDTHYLTNSARSCSLRVNNPKECTAVPLDADECTTCQTGYYRTADKLKCIINPPGIAGCLIYTDALNCSLCKPGFYKNYQNRCIPSLTLISNCRIYSDENLCTACLDGFLLTDSKTCTTPEATNCAEVLDLKTCKTCATGYGLLKTNDVTSCVLVQLTNCAVPVTVAPFTCARCNPGWYPSANGLECLTVTATIAGCVEYDSATTCKTCQKAGILNVARTSCDITRYTGFVDDNCDSNVLNATPSCAQCALGSYFQGDSCVVCPNNGLSFGCLSCDPLAPANCLLCSSGFYMTKSGVCIRNTNLPSGPGTPTVPSPPTSSIKKVVTFTLGLGALYMEGL